MWTYLGKCCSPIPQRHIISFMVMIAITIQYMHRTAFTIGLTILTYRRNTSEKISYERQYDENVSIKTEFYRRYTDDFSLVSLFNAFYIISHIPGGVISDKYGPKKVVVFSCLLPAICTALLPRFLRRNQYALTLNTALSGLAQGVLFPAQSVFVARWSPPDERNFSNCFMSIGIYVGVVTGMIVSGMLLNHSVDWDNVFYVFTSVTLVWFVFWLVFVHDSVDKHPFLSEKEFIMVKQSLQDELDDEFKPSYLPVLKSTALWATVLASAGNDFVLFMLITLIPSYISSVNHVDVESRQVVNTIPFLMAIVFTLASSGIAGTLTRRQIMSKTIQHKVFLIVSNQGPCFCFIASSFVGCCSIVVLIALFFAAALTGVISSSVRVANVDMAPNLAGFTMALINGGGATIIFFAQPFLSLIVRTGSVEDWREAFLISSLFASFSTVIYLIFGTSEIQKWNFSSRTSSLSESNGNLHLEDSLDEEARKNNR